MKVQLIFTFLLILIAGIIYAQHPEGLFFIFDQNWIRENKIKKIINKKCDVSYRFIAEFKKEVKRKRKISTNYFNYYKNGFKKEHGNKSTTDIYFYDILKTDNSQIWTVSNSDGCVPSHAETIFYLDEFFWQPSLSVNYADININEPGNQWKICCRKEWRGYRDYLIDFEYDANDNVLMAKLNEYEVGACGNDFSEKDKLIEQVWNFNYRENKLTGYNYSVRHLKNDQKFNSRVEIEYNKKGLPKYFKTFFGYEKNEVKSFEIKKYKYSFF